MRKLSSIIILCLASVSLAMGQHVRYVNTFIGTDGTGHTFPGPSRPFGMVQPGPDCSDTDWNYTSGYQYRDTAILGFSQTHLSGTGIGELGDILMLPGFGNDRCNIIDKSSEYSEPGYYSVMKMDGVKVELTCTDRVALHRYTFPSRKAEVLIDFTHGIRFLADTLVLDSEITFEGDRSIKGYCHTRNWVERRYSFHITFDRPFTARKCEGNGKDNAPAYVLTFRTGKDRQLLAKIAMSATSPENALKNMECEAPDWDFDRIRKEASEEWEKYLSRIDIEGGDREKTIFYTALYHLLLQPSDISDCGEEEYYSTLSNWDIYRGAFPLLQIIAPEKIDPIISSMLAHCRQYGFLPIWSVWGKDNYCMIGNHAIPMIVSAYVNGFRGYDTAEAYEAVKTSSLTPHIHSEWDIYEKYGYFPFDIIQGESVSKTLENGYDDWCASILAGIEGHDEDSIRFAERAGYWKNLFDPESGLMRGKDSQGRWRTPFDPYRATSPMNNPGDYTEANAWQYFWTPAQHDIDGLTEALGGRKALEDKLDEFFGTRTESADKYLGQEAMVGLYAHGNEPCHHIAYLYSYTDTPSKGHDIIRSVISDYYSEGPDGLKGNDDCGQMSAWYILSSMGFYPVNPASGEFVTGVPRFRKVTIHLPERHTFIIEAEGSIDGKVDGISLDGKAISNIITYKQIMDGGKLVFRLSEDSEAYRLLPFGAVRPEGHMKEQMRHDMDGILSKLPEMVPELIGDPIYSSGRLDADSKAKDLGNTREGDSEGDEQYKWWNSETQSNWRDAYIRNALLLQDSAGTADTEKYISDMLATQDDDGYLGIYTPSLRYRGGNENGELWAKTTLLRGLLGYYEYTSDKRVWDAIVKAVDNVMAGWPAYRSHPFDAGTEYNGGAAHGLTFTDVLERMYQLTGDRKYRDYSLFLYKDYSANFSSECDAQSSNASDSTYRLKCHGVHTYEHIRPLTVAACADPSLLPVLEEYLRKIEKCTTVTGGAIGDEWIGGRYADAESTGYEYCSLHELMDSYCMLLQKTGDPDFADRIENIYYNAAMGARHPYYPAIAYLKTDNSYEMHRQHRYKYSPVHQDVAVCCVPNAMRITPYFLRSAWMEDSDGVLTAQLICPNTLDTYVNGSHVRITSETSYPDSSSVTMTFSCPDSIAIKVRIPYWAKGISTDKSHTVDGRYLRFTAVDGEKVSIRFEDEVRTVAGNDGRHYFAKGPLFYSLPMEGEEIRGREYIEGYFDIMYGDAEGPIYKYEEGHEATFSEGCIETELINTGTGKPEKVKLFPMRKTILRQTGF